MKPKILIGCPTHSSKGYALKLYKDGIKRLSYKNYDVFIVDNSDDDEYIKKIKKMGLPVVKGPKIDNVIEVYDL